MKITKNKLIRYPEILDSWNKLQRRAVKISMIVIILLLISSVVLAIPFKPRGNIMGGRATNNTNTTSPYWNITDMKYIETEKIGIVQSDGDTMEMYGNTFENYFTSNTTNTIFRNTGDQDSEWWFDNPGYEMGLRFYDKDGEYGWIRHRNNRTEVGDKYNNQVMISRLMTEQFAINVSDIWLYMDADHIESENFFGICPNETIPRGSGIDYQGCIDFERENPGKVVVGVRGNSSILVFDEYLDSVDFRSPVNFTDTITSKFNITNGNSIYLTAVDGDYLRIYNDEYQTNIQSSNNFVMGGTGGGDNTIFYKTSGGKTYLRIYDESGTSNYTNIYASGGMGHIGYVGGTDEIEFSSSIRFDGSSGLANPPSECTAGSFMTYFNGSNSICTATTGITGTMNMTGCNLTYTNGLLTSFVGCASE